MKTVRLLLAVVCLAGFAARVPAAETRLFRAGAARVDITPAEFPVINSGGFLERQAERAHDRLMSRALILDDGTTRFRGIVR